MTNWANPTVTSLYADFVAEVKDRDLDLAKGLDPALVTATNIVAGMQRWNSANIYWEKYNGTAWSALASAYAINISGNAATTTLATSATLATNASNLAITNDNTTNTTVYPTWVTTTTGNLPNKVSSTKLSFNPSTGILSATGFAGNLTGTATVAATLNSTLPVTLGGSGVNTISGVLFGNGTAAYSVATAAQLVSAISTTPVSQATNLAAGAANRIPYQSTTATTSFVAAPTTTNTFLGWDGTGFAWLNPTPTTADNCIYENNRTISSNYTLTTNKSGMSAGPITIASGVSVTIPTAGRWVIL